MRLVIDDRYITLEEIYRATEVSLSDDAAFTADVSHAHTFLMSEIQKGKPIYGVTTGYGASGKNYLSYEQSECLQQNLYRFHGCGVGEFLSQESARYALLCRLVSLSKGKSGVSYALLTRFILLLEKNITPCIPSLGSVGASGDLTPLSYIAAVIAGEREVWYEGKMYPTHEVYEKLGIAPYVFKPKEALAVMNGTTIMSAIALSALKRFETILATMESFVAGMFEVLLGDTTPLDAFVHAAKPFAGQIQSAANIRAKLAGSKLTHGRDDRYEKFFADNDLNIQDTYSMRCAPQVLGVVRDNLTFAKQWVEQEINSVNDNPLIDGVHQKIYTSGNFYGGYVAHAMDTMKICAANLADLLDKEFALLVDHKFNRGLGENLKLSKDHYFHGFKAMQISLSSLSADVIKNTTAASIHSRPTESLNQDKVSMGTTAALDFQKMTEPLELMLGIALLGLAQAVDIRGSDQVSSFLLRSYTRIRELSPALWEDRRMDRDIYALKEALFQGAFV
jgi:histidine ammonia-lyase